MRILVDVDGVCANLIQAVLDEYNPLYGDNLKYEHIINWDVSLHVHPACGQKISAFYEDPMIYKKVKPIWKALDGVLRLRAVGDEVVFVSSGFFPAKVEWLQKNGFLSDYRGNWRYSKEVVIASDKSMIVGDVIVDDKPSNLIGHTGILFNQPWNSKESYPIRADDWPGVLSKIDHLSMEKGRSYK